MHRSIKTIFKKVRPEKTLMLDAATCISDYIQAFVSRLLNKQRHLSLFSIKEEMDKIVHPDILSHIEKELDITFNKYYKKGVTSDHADFSINLLKKWLKTEDIQTFCFTDLLYIATCLDYLCLEICELSGRVANEDRKVRVTCEHVDEAIMNDEALSYTFKKTKHSNHTKNTKKEKRAKRKSRG